MRLGAVRSGRDVRVRWLRTAVGRHSPEGALRLRALRQPTDLPLRVGTRRNPESAPPTGTDDRELPAPTAPRLLLRPGGSDRLSALGRRAWPSSWLSRKGSRLRWWGRWWQ